MKEESLPYERVIFVCCDDACRENKSKKLVKRINEEIKACGAKGRIRCVSTNCLHLCDKGANAVLAPSGLLFSRLRPKDAATLVKTAIGEDANR